MSAGRSGMGAVCMKAEHDEADSAQTNRINARTMTLRCVSHTEANRVFCTRFTRRSQLFPPAVPNGALYVLMHSYFVLSSWRGVARRAIARGRAANLGRSARTRCGRSIADGNLHPDGSA